MPTFANEKEEVLLKDWALSRCIAKSAPHESAGDDAAKSAAALLERSSAAMATYDKIDQMINTALAHPLDGSVAGDYNLLKCLALYHSNELNTLVAHEGMR